MLFFYDSLNNPFLTESVAPNVILNIPNQSPKKKTDSNYSYGFNKWNYDFNTPVNSDLKIYPTWNTTNKDLTVEFGSYPKSVITDTSIITQLKNAENGAVSGTVLTLNGINYKVLNSENSFKSEAGTQISSGLQYFKFEPIVWRVMFVNNDGSYHVISKDIIDTQYWNTNSYQRTNPTDNSVETIKNDYSKSTIRTWLNRDFLESSFSVEEQGKILETNVDNSASSSLQTSSTYFCDNTLDKVYLPSYEETQTYFVSDTDRVFHATDYALSVGTLNFSSGNNTYGNGVWWTRSAYEKYADRARYIYMNGSTFSNMVFNNDCGIRPSLTYNPSSN